MYFNCFETQVRPRPGGGVQILFKPPYPSALMGGFRGGNRKITSYMGFYREYAIGHDSPPPSERSVTPPPPGKCWTSSGTLEKDSFL